MHIGIELKAMISSHYEKRILEASGHESSHQKILLVG